MLPAEQFSVHVAGPGSIGRIRSIAHATWPISYAEILSPEQVEYMLELMYSETAIRQQMERGHTFLVLEQDGTSLAFASFEPANGTTKGPRLHKLYVLPEAQRNGVGTLLLEAVHSAIKKYGGETIDLNVNKFNPAKRFYERAGYTILREEVLDIGNGFVMDDHVMRKRLTPK
ncbi:MAG: GNAT family N-acetyltransferase [Flavobacteriales bacterium]|nr:GNAT family N-acetyltransferase [Flavobacteriales bacterium]MBP6643299.1 GNAT family N-acetyltransferase [Flavobacteriales bacterium]